MSEVNMGQVWYYMMYLSENPTIRFWGRVDMMINTGAFMWLFISVWLITTGIVMMMLDSFKVKRGLSFFLGIIMSYIVFFGVIVKQSGDLTTYSWEIANNLYIADKSKFDGYNAFSKDLK